MKIKIKITDTEKLRAALAQVNGAATAHTAGVWAVADQAQKAEAHLDALSLNKKDRIGAARDYVSGDSVSNSYARKSWSDRAATRIRLVRGSSCWYITWIKRVTIGQSGGWAQTLLTAGQRDLVTARFQSQFGVLPVADTAIAKAIGKEA